MLKDEPIGIEKNNFFDGKLLKDCFPLPIPLNSSSGCIPECNCRDSLRDLYCGSNAFQDYFDDAKESRVKKIPKVQESRIKFQESRIKTIKIKIQDLRFKNQEKTQSR